MHCMYSEKIIRRIQLTMRNCLSMESASVFTLCKKKIRSSSRQMAGGVCTDTVLLNYVERMFDEEIVEIYGRAVYVLEHI